MPKISFVKQNLIMTESFIENIFICCSAEEYPTSAVSLAQQIAEKANKTLCFLTFFEKKINPDLAFFLDTLNSWASDLKQKTTQNVIFHVLPSKNDFQDFITKAEASILIFQLSNNKGFDKVMPLLKLSRELRIPYIFSKPYFENISLKNILVPITFLIEDREKGVFATNLGRLFSSNILLMPANDYGSKTEKNKNAITTLVQKAELSLKTIDTTKDSFEVELEAIHRAEEFESDFVIISASRSYGLDDIIFGPKELRCIEETNVPLLLINPRADLYILCN